MLQKNIESRYIMKNIFNWFFQKKSYIKIITQEKDNLDFYYGFISTISPESQSLRALEEIVTKTQKDEKDDRIYYLTIKKKQIQLIYLFIFKLEELFLIQMLNLKILKKMMLTKLLEIISL